MQTSGSNTSGSHMSPWLSAAEPAIYKTLTANTETEVVVIGGGIAGITTAYCLAKSGKAVVLLEDGHIGSGESGRTTAHLVTALDDRYYDLEKIHGEEGAKLAAESHAAAIGFIESVVKSESIDCDFERLEGYLFRHPSDKEDVLEKELEAAAKAGLNVSLLKHVPGIPGETGGCLKFERQAQFHIMKYLNGLCAAFEKLGGRIYTNTHAKDIGHNGVVTAGDLTVKADHIVVATNTPVNDRFVIHTKQAPYRTYVIAATVKKGTLPRALWWDTGDHKINPGTPPYHYVRLQDFNDDYELLICGGEDHITGKTGDGPPEGERYALLEDWARRRFPIETVTFRWSGQVMEPMDGLAYIGRNPGDKDNVYIISGDSGNGMTHGTIGALLLTDLINGRENPWESLYNPSRFKILQSGKTFLKDNLSVLVSFFKRRLSDKEIETLSDIEEDKAYIINLDGDLYGIYHDPEGGYHMVSAVCPHLRCTVAWNADEHSWDCPCHGSRFTVGGEVINGPANTGLRYQYIR